MNVYDVIGLVTFWSASGVICCACVYTHVEKNPRFTGEARAFVSVLAGVLAPIMVLVGLLWLLRRGVPAAVRATGRGARDAWRAVRPQREPKPEVPRAKVVPR
jgi:hypothetical protein